MLSTHLTHELFTIIVSVTGSLMWRPTDGGRAWAAKHGIAKLYSVLRPVLDNVRPGLAGMNISHSPPRQGGYRIVTALCSRATTAARLSRTSAHQATVVHAAADAELEAMPQVLQCPAPRPTPFLPPSDPTREPSPEAKMRLDALEMAVREGVKDPKVAREIARRLPSSGPSTSAIVTACNMRADEIALDLPRRRVNA